MIDSIMCPKCGRMMLDHDQEGTMRIRTRLILVPRLEGVMHAVCPQCKQLVALPLKVHDHKQGIGTAHAEDAAIQSQSL